MFDFLRRSRRPELAATVRKSLMADQLPAGLDPLTLSVLQRRASYSGRGVTDFRVFDPAAATASGINPRRFEDLDVHPELILAAGHVEHGGAIVLKPRATTVTRTTPPRLLADRRAHDDEQVVFPNGPS
jgi:hypothetical protein